MTEDHRERAKQRMKNMALDLLEDLESIRKEHAELKEKLINQALHVECGWEKQGKLYKQEHNEARAELARVDKLNCEMAELLTESAAALEHAVMFSQCMTTRHMLKPLLAKLKSHMAGKISDEK